MGRVWRAIPTVLIMTLVVLPIVASASPPDPTWLDGIYDEADGDDLVTQVGDTVACPNYANDASPVLVRLPEALLPIAKQACSHPL